MEVLDIDPRTLRARLDDFSSETMAKQTTTSASRRQPVGPRPVNQDRRTRRRLRALCDEVLASYRVASQQDIISETERREAKVLLAQVTPRVA